jgi:hypothetical protein
MFKTEKFAAQYDYFLYQTYIQAGFLYYADYAWRTLKRHKLLFFGKDN